MYAFELGVVLLATVALWPVLCFKNIGGCNEAPKADVSRLNETEQIKVLGMVSDNLSCKNVKSVETNRMKRQEILQETYCWGVSMMLKNNHKSKLHHVYSSFLNRTANLYMETNDSKFFNLRNNCQTNWPRDIALVIMVIVFGFLAYGFYRMKTRKNQNPYRRMSNFNRRSEIVCLDNGMDVVVIEPDEQNSKNCSPSENESKLKSCLPSKTEPGPKPKKAVTWTANEVRVYDVHELEDFRDPVELERRRLRKMNRVAIRASSANRAVTRANALQSMIDIGIEDFTDIPL